MFLKCQGGSCMPVINVDWTVSKDNGEKRLFIDYITKTVSRAIKVQENVINVFLREYSIENSKDDSAVFTITWSKTPEREDGAKKEIIKALTDYVSSTSNIKPEKVVVFFNDLDGKNVGVGGKQRS